ncbi:unnamed protein product [Closterium sp. NIES-54]
MALRPSSVPLRVPLPPPPESSLLAVPDPESDLARAASPTVSRLLASVVTDPSLESTAASALVAELLDFVAACCLDYAATLVPESASPPSVGGECALGTDVLEDRQEEFECFVAAVPRFASMLLASEGDPDAPDILTTEAPSPYGGLAAMDAERASWKSTGTYVDTVPPSRANIVDGMWIFRVKRPSGSPPAFKARYVARGFSQRQGVDYFQTFSPTPKMATLWVLLHVAAQRDYELHSLDFSIAFLQGSLHEEIWLRRPPGFAGSFPAGLVLAPGTSALWPLGPSAPRPLGPCPSAPALALATAATAAATAATTTAAIAALAYYAPMASLRVLAFDHEGRPIQFDTWLENLQLYLLSDSKDSVSQFNLASGAATAPPATADSLTCSQWLTRDAAARLAIRNHLPLAECAHFGQHRTAQALYNDVVARYSLRATSALGRLLLPYLFPELSAFATVEDLVYHLRTSDARCRATVPAEFLDRNPPPMFITLCFIVTRLLDSLCSVRDRILSLDPTSLTVDLLEEKLLAAETSAVAVGAARGTPRTPFFEGCSPSPLAPSYASAAAANVPGAEDVRAASAGAKRRSSKGKGGRGGGGGSGSGGGGSSGGSGGGGVGGDGGIAGGGWGSASGSAGSGGSGGSGDGGTGGGRTGARRGGSRGGQRQQQQHWSKTQSPQQLCEWLFQRGTSWGSDSCPYVIRTGDHVGQTRGRLHTQHRCFSLLNDAWRSDFGDEVERPCWAYLLRYGVAIFDLYLDVILSAMYALSVSAEGDCYRCLPPDPGIAAADLGASESGTLPGTVPAEALHTFTLDTGASRYFFRDSTTLTPLPAPVPVRLADPSRVPVVACSSTVLPCLAVSSDSLSGLHLPLFSTNLVSTAALQDAMVTTTTLGGQRVAICKCTRTGRHLATFTRRPGSSLYTLATEPSQVAASAQVSASGQVAPPCLCRLLSHQTLLWHHHLGHPSLPRLHGMHSRLLVSGLPSTDLPVLRLHFVGGGEFSSNLLRDFCPGEGITQSFTLPESPQKNGIAEHRIGLVMEVARTSMIHAAALHFLWPFAVLYAAHQLNLWPRISLPETSPTLRWTRKVGDASVFRVRGSRAFVRDMSADKLSARAIPCFFLGFVPNVRILWDPVPPTHVCNARACSVS